MTRRAFIALAALTAAHALDRAVDRWTRPAPSPDDDDDDGD